MIANTSNMHTTTVMCIMTQSTLTTPTPGAYSQTQIDTSTLTDTPDSFYPNQAGTPSAYIHLQFFSKYEIHFRSLPLTH